MTLDHQLPPPRPPTHTRVRALTLDVGAVDEGKLIKGKLKNRDHLPPPPPPPVQEKLSLQLGFSAGRTHHLLLPLPFSHSLIFLIPKYTVVFGPWQKGGSSLAVPLLGALSSPPKGPQRENQERWGWTEVAQGWGWWGVNCHL